MNELSIRTTELPIFANKELNAATKKIANISVKIKKNLFEVSLILAKVSDNKLFEQDGFKSASEYAMKTFGFKKSAAYSLIAIGKEYTSPALESNLPHEDGNDFTTTQIEKVLPLKSREKVIELVESGEITPDMSCKEIEKVVKDLTKKDEPVNSVENETTDTTENKSTILDNYTEENEIASNILSATMALERLVELTQRADLAELLNQFIEMTT